MNLQLYFSSLTFAAWYEHASTNAIKIWEFQADFHRTKWEADFNHIDKKLRNPCLAPAVYILKFHLIVLTPANTSGFLLHPIAFIICQFREYVLQMLLQLLMLWCYAVDCQTYQTCGSGNRALVVRYFVLLLASIGHIVYNKRLYLSVFIKIPVYSDNGSVDSSNIAMFILYFKKHTTMEASPNIEIWRR